MQELGSDLFEVAKRRIGQVLCGKITIESVVDVGGMAAVYAAKHRNGKRLAVKILHAQYAANPDVTERFLREGYVANQIEHRGAVEILDDDISEDGAAFLVMELLVGESLDKWIRRSGGKLPPIDVLAFSDQVLDVLDAFHERGIIHRDIKPANLFITNSGTVKVLDFGLARVRDVRVRATPTVSGTILGTASYMSPEQAQGKTEHIDLRTDIFAMGAVMYHALSGQVVHKGKTSIERLLNAMQKPAEPVATYAPELNETICQLVDTSLRFDKNERFASASAMREAVRQATLSLQQRPSPVGPPPVPNQPKRPAIAPAGSGHPAAVRLPTNPAPVNLPPAVAPRQRPTGEPTGAPSGSGVGPARAKFPSAADTKRAVRRVQTAIQRGPVRAPDDSPASPSVAPAPPTEPQIPNHPPAESGELFDPSIAVDFVEPAFDGDDPPTRERPR